MARKKILWLCSWYPGKTDPFNGDFIQRHARAAALNNDIHVIHVIETSSPQIQRTMAEIHQSAGLTEEIIYIKRKENFLSRTWAHYRWLAVFRKALRRYIAENGRPALVHVHVPMKAGLFGIWMKQKYGIPYVVTEHWGIYNDVEVLNYQGRSPAFKHYTKKIFREAAAFISVSRYLAEGVNKMVLPKDFEVIPNVVNTDLFIYKEREITPFRFIHVSNMVPLKNAGGILEAFKLLKEKYGNAQLVMAGNTDTQFNELASTLGLSEEDVQFLGEVPYEQVAKEMQQSHAFILFSNIENSPCVIGEALCCGLPVITTPVGGIPELVDDSNAILTERGNVVELASAMRKVIEMYSSFDRKKIAEDAKRKFSYPVIGEKFDVIYSEWAR